MADARRPPSRKRDQPGAGETVVTGGTVVKGNVRTRRSGPPTPAALVEAIVIPDATDPTTPSSDRDASDPAVAASSTGRQATRLGRAEEALRTSEHRYRAVVDSLAEAVVVQDAAGRIVTANPAARAVLGLSDDAVTGLTSFDPRWQAVHEDGTDLSGKEHPATITRRTGRPCRDVVVGMRSPTGEVRWQLVNSQPLLDESGLHVTGVVTSLSDVTQLRDAEAKLDLQALVRSALAESYERIPDEATLEEAAQAICDGLVTLPLFDMAAVVAFLGPSDGQVVGLSAPSGYPVAAGDHLPLHRADVLGQRAQAGPWAEYARPDPADGGWMARATAAGLKALAYGPIVQGDHVDGMLAIGTFDQSFARTLVEQMPSVLSFGATSSVRVAERLHVMRRKAELRAALASVLASSSFHPVFQPIVDLKPGEVVGYESLTRFDSGQRPDLCFADAWSVGLGPDLEIATIEAAVAAARRLPPGRWLDLNVSPRLLEDPDRLSRALWPAERPIVLEITEHDVIQDYRAVREAIRALGRDVRLAVDDAGAGVANFGHIIELRPDFVKLDTSLVRRVNAHLGRQALVVAMRHFSRTAGCRLVAEGVETEEEAGTLAGLGVEFGQGYLFGHPEPVEVWAAGGNASRDGQHASSSSRRRSTSPRRQTTPGRAPARTSRAS